MQQHRVSELLTRVKKGKEDEDDWKSILNVQAILDQVSPSD